MSERWLFLVALWSLAVGCDGDLPAVTEPPPDAQGDVRVVDVPTEAADDALLDAPSGDAALDVAAADAVDDSTAADSFAPRDDVGALDTRGMPDVLRDAAADRVAFDVARDVTTDVVRDVPRDTLTDAPRPTGIARPFGSHPHTFATGTITPSRSRAAMDDAVANFYDRWKAAHVRQRCGAGRYVIDTGGETAGMTVSEAHGWGMVIVVYMAGHDPDARTIFDGMVRYYQDHPSAIDPALMAWAQGSDCRNVDGDDAATDGDLDIAYALLLAERQWGNGGAIDYGALARRSMAAIVRREVHPSSRTLRVGDWATDARWRDGTRLSDYMFDHLRSFRAASGDAVWDTVLARSYEVVATLQRDFTTDASGARTGLLPDFAVGMNARTPRPAPASWLESAHDGHFYWNACRTPWRVATDYLLHGEARSRDAARTMNAWVRRATGDVPTRIGTGYRLDGTRINAGAEMAFIAPFAVAAAVEASNQAWLDALWGYLSETPFAGARYYGNTIRLQVMLTVSRNVWAP